MKERINDMNGSGGNTGATAFAAVARSEGEADREERIKELLSKMTLDEKIYQMSGDESWIGLADMLLQYNHRPFPAGENKRLGIPPIKFTDGPRGLCLDHSTCFPVAMARGGTWDTELQERVGDTVGYEARAQGADYYGGVCINVPRHPGWGRSQETFGDDPHHLGAMAVAMINGVQRHVMACAKHFACNSIEEARFFVDVQVDERTLREIYLRHFEKCVKAGVASVMSAYNKVNGYYCGHNRHLLRGILKEEWGFDGFVMSDFIWGVKDGVAGANAGLDMEMPSAWRYGRKLKKAVRRGDVDEEVIDEAVTRILRQKARFARAGDPAGYDREKVASSEHAMLALEVAQKSIVLLKNEGKVLPLGLDSIRNIAVIGELADKANIGDRGSSRVRPPYVVTPLHGIRDKVSGRVEVVYDSGKNLANARRVAGSAEAVIVVVGLTYKEEGEYLSDWSRVGGDRDDLNLPAGQEALIKAVAGAADRCVVVLEGGSAITMEAWKDEVEAILMVWYPGMEGGHAIADILFGDINPSGKLPITFPESADQLPFFDKKAKTIEYGYYHGYRLFDKEGLEPAFPFGFGLSYTEYEYGNLRLSERRVGKGGRIKVYFDVTNIGEMEGHEVVQLYVGYRGSKVDRPVKELKGFARLDLTPGETKTGLIEVKAEDLAYYDIDAGAWETEEIEYVVYVGPSSRYEDLQLSDTFKVSGP
jgi:beta-glucosidase